ncbi:Zinc finger MYM-type protein 1 [Biomphalaria glabrata]|nr:Zinc finger MYM-type protein 1 [Biomphalaria glabrata]
MSSKKLSGAQQRKRKREQEADAKISGLFMQRFLKLGQTEVDDKEESDIDNVGLEAVNDPPSCYQLDDSLMTSAIQLQPSNSSTQTAEATSDSKHRMLLDSHDFGYIDFDSITGLSNVADNLRMEWISRGPEVFQNKDANFAVSAGRSMTLTWFKRRNVENLYEDGTQTSETQNDAYSLLQNVMNFNFITLLDFWHAVLSKIDRIQKRLQDPSMNFHDAALDLEGLQQRLSSIREDVCITAVNAAKVLCEKLGIRIEGRIKRRKQMPGENAGDAGLAAVEEITRIMKSVIDRLIQEMTTRFGRLKTLDEKFGSLFNISKLFANDTSNDIQQHCVTLADFYKIDIDGTELFVEISDCSMLLKTRPDATPSSPL